MNFKIIKIWYGILLSYLCLNTLLLNTEGTGTITDYPDFDAKADAIKVKEAIEGLGTNEKTINDIFSTRSLKQRLEIQKEYSGSLSQDIQGDASDEYEDLLRALIRTPIENLAHYFRVAVDRWGTDKRLVIQVLVSCTEKGTMPTDMRDAYKRMYGNNVESAMSGESALEDDVHSICMEILEKKKREDPAPIGPNDQQKANEHAKKMVKEVKNWGNHRQRTDECLIQFRFEMVTLTMEEFKKENQNVDLVTVINYKMKEDLNEFYTHLVLFAQNRVEYFAGRLSEILRDDVSETHALILIIVNRSEIDLKDIECAYQQRFGSLRDAINNKLEGDFKDLLLLLLSQQNPLKCDPAPQPGPGPAAPGP